MKTTWLLLIILILGSILRLILLDSRPAGFTWDEAALGYNAFSLLKTGRDEWGTLLPIVFKSFGDFKPGLYIYLTVPVVHLLGLTETAVRLPAAIFGILSLLGLYYLAKSLVGERAALFSIALMAISPWAIHFSRGAWEANLNLFLTIWGMNYYLAAIRKNHFPWAICSVLFFGISFWAYQGAKLTTPLLMLSTLLLFRPRFSWRQGILAAAIFLGLLFPIFINFSGQSGRLKVFSVFSYTRNKEEIASLLNQDNLSQPSWWFTLLHSEPQVMLRGIGERYLNHFSPRFLFFSGDWSTLRHSTPYSGYLLLPQIAGLFLGLVYLFRHPGRTANLIFAWVLFAPLPAALSRDIVSGVRSLPLVVPLTIISGLGFHLLRFRWQKFASLVAIAMFFFYFLDLYFVHSPYFTAAEWLYPYKPAFAAIAKVDSQFDKIYFTPHLGQPYIFALFYLQIDPRLFQSLAHFEDNLYGDVGKVSAFDKYVFDSFYWPAYRTAPRTLFVGDQYELPKEDINLPGLIHLPDVTYPNGQIALRLVGWP